MKFSLIYQAALRTVMACAAVITTTRSAISQEWTSFKIDSLSSYSFTHDHLPDGRFVYGSAGEVHVQDTFGAATKTLVSRPESITFDPSFLAVRSASQALLGGGGYAGASGLFTWDPSAPTTPIRTPALATLQNYSAVFWRHPSSGREGWLICGANGSGSTSNLTFVSTDGAVIGAVTETLSDYSGGISVAANGDVYVSRSAWGPPDGEIIRFSAAQMDGAILSLDTIPAPLAFSAATVVFQAAASGSLAIDAEGRVWTAGYQIDYLQAHDPVSNVTRRFYPDHAALHGALGAPSYAVKTFIRDGHGYVGFLANDSFYESNSDITLGYKKVSELAVRSVQFITSDFIHSEGAGPVTINVTMTPAPSRAVTVNLSTAGTATAGIDWLISATSLVFDAENATRSFTITPVNDNVMNEGDEMVIIRLAQPSPEAEAGLGLPGTDEFILTLRDDDQAPRISHLQSFPTLKVGRQIEPQFILQTGGPVEKWTAAGLPPGLTINKLTGQLTGSPTLEGEYDSVVFTATNKRGRSVSRPYIIRVEPMFDSLVGSFISLVRRSGPTEGNLGLGARVDLTTTSRGSYSGKVYLGERTAKISGPLVTAGDDVGATTKAVFKGAPGSLTLTFTIHSDDGSISGSLGGEELSGMRLIKTPSFKTTADSAPNIWRSYLGVYNARLSETDTPPMDRPQGSGYASITFSSRLGGNVVGRLADDTSFTSSTALDIAGNLPIYAGFYKKPGSLLGAITLASDLPKTLGGSLGWTKPAQSSGRLYREGWSSPVNLRVTGGKYRAPLGSMLLLDASPSPTFNADASLALGGIESVGSSTSPKIVPFRITSSKTLSIKTPSKLRVVSSSGAISGSLVPERGMSAIPVKGLLIPETATIGDYDVKGHGFFILPGNTSGTSRSGSLFVQPR